MPRDAFQIKLYHHVDGNDAELHFVVVIFWFNSFYAIARYFVKYFLLFFFLREYIHISAFCLAYASANVHFYRQKLTSEYCIIGLIQLPSLSSLQKNSTWNLHSGGSVLSQRNNIALYNVKKGRWKLIHEYTIRMLTWYRSVSGKKCVYVRNDKKFN